MAHAEGDQHSRTASGTKARKVVDPEIRIVFWTSVVFGVFGLIPAAVYANAATRLGRPSTAYWEAFFKGVALAVLLWLVILTR